MHTGRPEGRPALPNSLDLRPSVGRNACQIWEIAARTDWRLAAVVVVVGMFMVAAILRWNRVKIRKRIHAIETQVSELRNEMTAVVKIQVALIRKLNGDSKGEISLPDPVLKKAGADFDGWPIRSPPIPARPQAEKP